MKNKLQQLNARLSSMKATTIGTIAVTAGSVSAMADGTMGDLKGAGVAFNTTDAVNVGILVLTAVAVLWGVRKAISFANRG